MHNVGVGNLLVDALDKGLPHVHGYRFNRLLLLRAKRLPQPIGCLDGPVLPHVQDPRPIQIRQQRDVGLPALEAPFVHPQMLQVFQLPALQAPLYRPTHDLLGRVSTQTQQLARLTHAGAGQQ